jgi:predicted nucleotidyltransferase
MGQWDQYLQHQREEVRRQDAAIDARRQRARAVAVDLAALLAREFHVSRVLLFGSLVAEGFSLESDIDLAVSGLEPDRFFEAWSALSQASDFAVDLIVLETASDSLRAVAVSEGVTLYDREREPNR